MKDNKGKIHYGIFIVLSVCAFYGVTLGVLNYTIGNFFLPVSKDIGCGVGQVSLYSTISGIVMAICFPIFRVFIERHINLALTIGALCLTVSMFGLSGSSSLWQFYMWAVLYGVGTGFFNGATLPSLIKRWFYKKSGTALGIGLATAAAVGAIMNPVIASVIAKHSWRTGYAFLGVLVALLMLPFTIFVVKLDPKDKNMLPFGFEADNKPASDGAAPEILTGPTLAQAKKLPQFKLMLLMAPLFSIGFAFTSHLAAFGNTIGLSATVSAALTSASLVGGMTGKLTLGMLGDKFGARTPFTMAQLSIVLGVSCVAFGYSSAVLLVVGTFLFGYGACTTALMPAMLTSAIFGSREYNKILTWFTTSCSFVGAFGTTIYGFLYDIKGNYFAGMIFCICVAAFNLVLGMAALKNSEEISKM